MLAVSHLLLLSLGARLTCWPFEVEGEPIVVPAEPAQPLPVVPAPSPPPPAVVLPRPTVPAYLPLLHEASYEIRYGLFGTVGTLTFSASGLGQAADGSAPLVKLRGQGQGSILGLGGMRRTIESDFDPTTLESRRWTILRTRDGQAEGTGTLDTATRATGGVLHLNRSNPGQAPAAQTVTFALPTTDPLGMLWRLRTAPPAPGQTDTVQLLDGQALWRLRITTAPGREILADGNRTALRLNGEVTPIFYDGQPDSGRPTRKFTLWLSDSRDRLPLRMEVPVGIADVVMTLIETRPASLPSAAPAGRDGQLTGAVPGARNL